MSYVVSIVPKMPDVKDKTDTSLSSAISWYINDKGIKSGSFGYSNVIYNDSPDPQNMKWGNVEFFKHADDYVTVLLYSEYQINPYIRRLDSKSGQWKTPKWGKFMLDGL